MDAGGRFSSNQFKAYHHSFVAGEAARDRLRRTLWDYDLDQHHASGIRQRGDRRVRLSRAAEWLLPAESPDIVAIAHRVQHDAEARSREPDPFGPTSMTRTDAPWFLSAFAPELSLTALLLRPGSTW